MQASTVYCINLYVLYNNHNISALKNIAIQSLSLDQDNQHSPHIIYILNYVFPCVQTFLPVCLQVVLHAGGVEIQSAAQPAQVCWVFHRGSLGLTGLTSTI